MKPEEALKNIGDWISEETRKRKYDKITLIELADSLIVIKGVVEKQVAKKLRIEPIGNVCPECFYDTAFMSKGEEYCPNCGQKLDWEETP